MYGLLYRLADAIARGLALVGGGILIALIVLTCVSIAGRVFVPLDIGIGPIRGIYDMTEIGVAAAIFAFLPWTQFQQAHARVDLFRSALPRRLDQALDFAFDVAMVLVAAVGTWRLYLGMQDKMSYGETTLIAQIPVWQGYAAGLVGACGFVLVSLFCVLRSGRRLAGVDD